jgi:hypothetical protein
MDEMPDTTTTHPCVAPVLHACARQRAGVAAHTLSIPSAPAVAVGFREDHVYRLTAATEALDEVIIDDEPLTRDALGAWTWCPGFYAGRVRGVARRAGRDVAELSLDVSPHPDKLGCDAFESMVEDLWAFDPSLALGTEPATTETGTHGRSVGPYVAFERLRRHGPSFVRALAGVAERPRRRLVRTREQVPAHHLRHVDVTTTLAALRDRDALACLQGAPTWGTPMFDAPTTRETLDSTPNRALAALVRDMRAKITRLLRRGDRASARGEPASTTRTSELARWPERRRVLEELDCCLARAERKSPLRDVTRRELTAAGLTAIQSDPVYARAWSTGWRALREGVDGDEYERHSLSPTWEIYERWCYLSILRREQSRSTSDAGGSWRVLRGRFRGARIDRGHALETPTGTTAVLFQPIFPGRPGGRDVGPCSISLRRIPDIVVVRFDGESLRSWTVYDAKYRSGRANVLEAMTSAHVYRDALRWSGRCPDEAVLLLPTLSGVESLAARSYREAHGVGVEVASPPTGGEVRPIAV